MNELYHYDINKYLSYEGSSSNFSYNFATDTKEFLTDSFKQKYIFDDEEWKLVP